MTILLEQEAREVQALGVRIPSGQIARTARWTTLMGGTERLIDLLADEHFRANVTLLPADDTPLSGRLAAQLCRSLARRSVAVGRARTAEWEAYADQLTEACKTTFADGYSQRWADAVTAGHSATPLQVMTASLDPMGRHRWSLRLEHLGTELLHALGLPATRPDVKVSGRNYHVARPDAVAFHGVARYTLPKPCRYGRNGTQPGAEQRDRLTFTVNANGIAEVSTQPLTELLTTLRPVRGSIVRIGWRGHRRITWTVRKRKRTAAHASRAEARRIARTLAGADVNARGGRIVNPWDMASSSLRVACKSRGLVLEATIIERTIQTATAGQVVRFSDGATLTVMAGATSVKARGKTYPVREFARRAALAGLSVA